MATPENEESPITYEPYTVKSGISMAANLREAFKHADLLMTMKPQRVQVMLDTPVLMIPVEIFEEKDIEDLYYHAHAQQEHGVMFSRVIGTSYMVISTMIRQISSASRTIDLSSVTPLTQSVRTMPSISYCMYGSNWH